MVRVAGSRSRRAAICPASIRGVTCLIAGPASCMWRMIVAQWRAAAHSVLRSNRESRGKSTETVIWRGASRSLMRLYLVTIGIALCASARAQTAPVFDNSGNGTLNGAYFLRQVLTVVDPSSGAITRAVAITGTMTFDGKGGYNFTGQKVDSTAGGSASAYSEIGRASCRERV